MLTSGSGKFVFNSMRDYVPYSRDFTAHASANIRVQWSKPIKQVCDKHILEELFGNMATSNELDARNAFLAALDVINHSSSETLLEYLKSGGLIALNHLLHRAYIFQPSLNSLGPGLEILENLLLVNNQMRLYLLRYWGMLMRPVKRHFDQLEKAYGSSILEAAVENDSRTVGITEKKIKQHISGLYKRLCDQMYRPRRRFEESLHVNIPDYDTPLFSDYLRSLELLFATVEDAHQKTLHQLFAANKKVLPLHRTIQDLKIKHPAKPSSRLLGPRLANARPKDYSKTPSPPLYLGLANEMAGVIHADEEGFQSDDFKPAVDLSAEISSFGGFEKTLTELLCVKQPDGRAKAARTPVNYCTEISQMETRPDAIEAAKAMRGLSSHLVNYPLQFPPCRQELDPDGKLEDAAWNLVKQVSEDFHTLTEADESNSTDSIALASRTTSMPKGIRVSFITSFSGILPESMYKDIRHERKKKKKRSRVNIIPDKSPSQYSSEFDPVGSDDSEDVSTENDTEETAANIVRKVIETIPPLSVLSSSSEDNTSVTSPSSDEDDDMLRESAKRITNEVIATLPSLSDTSSYANERDLESGANEITQGIIVAPPNTYSLDSSPLPEEGKESSTIKVAAKLLVEKAICELVGRENEEDEEQDATEEEQEKKCRKVSILGEERTNAENGAKGSTLFNIYTDDSENTPTSSSANIELVAKDIIETVLEGLFMHEDLKESNLKKESSNTQNPTKASDCLRFSTDDEEITTKTTSSPSKCTEIAAKSVVERVLDGLSANGGLKESIIKEETTTTANRAKGSKLFRISTEDRELSNKSSTRSVELLAKVVVEKMLNGLSNPKGQVGSIPGEEKLNRATGSEICRISTDHIESTTKLSPLSTEIVAKAIVEKVINGLLNSKLNKHSTSTTKEIFSSQKDTSPTAVTKAFKYSHSVQPLTSNLARSAIEQVLKGIPNNFFQESSSSSTTQSTSVGIEIKRQAADNLEENNTLKLAQRLVADVLVYALSYKSPKADFSDDITNDEDPTLNTTSVQVTQEQCDVSARQKNEDKEQVKGNVSSSSSSSMGTAAVLVKKILRGICGSNPPEPVPIVNPPSFETTQSFSHFKRTPESPVTSATELAARTVVQEVLKYAKNTSKTSPQSPSLSFKTTPEIPWSVRKPNQGKPQSGIDELAQNLVDNVIRQIIADFSHSSSEKTDSQKLQEDSSSLPEVLDAVFTSLAEKISTQISEIMTDDRKTTHVYKQALYIIQRVFSNLAMRSSTSAGFRSNISESDAQSTSKLIVDRVFSDASNSFNIGLSSTTSNEIVNKAKEFVETIIAEAVREVSAALEKRKADSNSNNSNDNNCNISKANGLRSVSATEYNRSVPILWKSRGMSLSKAFRTGRFKA